MSETDLKEILIEKNQEFKNLFKEMSANLEQWKFSIEETKEGTRVRDPYQGTDQPEAQMTFDPNRNWLSQTLG